MSEIINCPFCGNTIDNDVYKCPFCNALFQEPKLEGLKFTELRAFFVIDVLTFGLFSTLWFFININPINKLTDSIKDTLKLNWLILLLGLNFGVYAIYLYHNPAYMFVSTIIQCLIYIALTYRTIRIIQKYTQKMYNVSIEANPYYIVLFNIFYLVHYIETYADRVQNKHEFFDWKSLQGIMLIILLLIIIFILRFNYEIYRLVS